MYAWIWRILPFGKPGKIIGSLLLAGAMSALLWFVVFPWVQPLLPYNDVQITQEGIPGGDPGDGSGDTGTDPGDGHDIPYDTDENNPVPSGSPSR